MNKITILLFLIFSLIGCKTDDDQMPQPPDPIEVSAITGYNVRWRDLADFDSSEVINLVDSLHPEMLRYPGGTLAHKWDWQSGIYTESGGQDDVPHPIADVKIMAEQTNSEIIFVLDIVNRSVEDQLSMLSNASIPINYLELGNELYSDDYENIFPTGKIYADTINSWTPKIRAIYPKVKIGVSMIGRSAGDDRKNFWNTNVVDNINVEINAHIYHLYVGETESVTARLDRFRERFLENTGKELWITEYGVKSQNVVQAIELADSIDVIADISLNHCIVSASGNYSKLTEDCNQLTPEGIAFAMKYGE